MPSGDSRNPRQQPPADGDQQPSPSSESGSRSGPTGREQDVDFGSYVSSTVRSSAELFGTTGRSSRSRKAKGTEPTEPATAESSGVARPASQPKRETVDTAQDVTRRSGRYWRETVVQEQGVEEYDVPTVAASAGGSGGTMDTIRSRFPWAFDEGGRPTVPVLGGLAALALLVLLAIWVAVQGDDPDTDGNATETPAVVIGAPTDETSSGEDDSTPTGFVPVPTLGPESDVTPTPQRGGDNQRNRDPNETPEANGGDPLADIELGPVAATCPERCLVRFSAGSNGERLMNDAHTRASFAADGFHWAFAEPEGIAWIESQADTTLVATSTDTLGLYIARVPSEETNDDRVAAFGEILDSAGPWRLVRAASVPANVRPLTDWGYEVSKVAPAPPGDIAEIDEPTDIATIEIGSLMDDVSESNIESSIVDLVAMGSNDGSGVGTRYYTTAGNMRAAEYLYARLESYGLNVWYEEFLTWEGFLAVNVIGEVPGRDPSSIYGVMAHFDTIADDTNDSPGADDNASGLAA
ncbi:MAG TPA: M28 family peptidase, partial [Thermomicrobiales bacterium]|nr:M28 family peptidase [Thermomicrobiales bacterium]